MILQIIEDCASDWIWLNDMNVELKEEVARKTSLIVWVSLATSDFDTLSQA